MVVTLVKCLCHIVLSAAMILFATASFCLAWFSLTAAQCYDQSGGIAPGSPCNTDSLPTFCCPSGYDCLSNGLCGKGPVFQMGTCSDQAWSGGSCVKYCPVGYDSIASCQEGAMGSSSPPGLATDYCCETTPGTTCCSGQNLFQLGDSAQVSTLPFTTLAASVSKKSGASTSAKATTTTSKASSRSSTSASAITSTITTQKSTLIATTSPIASLTESPPTPASSGGGLTTRAKVGAIVGGVFAFAFVGFFVYFITFLLKRRHQDKINAERARQIEARVGRNSNPNNDGRQAGGGFIDGAAENQSPGTGSPTSRRNWPSQSPGTERLSNHDRQYGQNVAGSPQQTISTTPETGHGYPTSADPYESAYMSRPAGGSNSFSPVSPQESYRPFRKSSASSDQELGTLDSVTALQYSQLPSHYSFSGVASASSTQVPPRQMTPAQELAAARLRSNISPVGLKGVDD